ncbi:MAG: tRNA pseudouridine(55) synthase TruB [Patescibacteria group bacterium]
MEGIVLFNKPKGKTSNEIVEYFKKLTNKKVGHGGTLDPLAEGLLILGIGEYTKQLNKFLKESKKTYIAEIELGAFSDTFDAEGKIEKTNKEIPEIEIIEENLKSFIGEIEQRPPIYSALKIKGKPAYEYARKGRKIEVEPRKVFVYDLKIIEYQKPVLKILAEVGSGVYIRSLANDLGEKLGCGGYLKSLIRTKINEFSLEDALDFEDIEKDYLEFLAKIYGRVQGVGFRFFVQRYAKELRIFGYAKNLVDGTVEVLAQGREVDLQEMIKNIKIGPRLAKVERLEIVFRKPKEYFYDFKIF